MSKIKSQLMEHLITVNKDKLIKSYVFRIYMYMKDFLNKKIKNPLNSLYSRVFKVPLQKLAQADSIFEID